MKFKQNQIDAKYVSLVRFSRVINFKILKYKKISFFNSSTLFFLRDEF